MQVLYAQRRGYLKEGSVGNFHKHIQKWTYAPTCPNLEADEHIIATCNAMTI